jgi:hypothetical protein
MHKTKGGHHEVKFDKTHVPISSRKQLLFLFPVEYCFLVSAALLFPFSSSSFIACVCFAFLVSVSLVQKLCGATHRRTYAHHMRFGRSNYANAKRANLVLSIIQTDYPILQQSNAQHRLHYKYPREQGDHLPQAREHHQGPGLQASISSSAPTEAGRQTMDGAQGNVDAVESHCDVVARAFVEHYYRTFDADRAALAALYGQTSMLSFEGHAVAGAEEICRKLAQLPFEQCRHTVCTVDCQPSPSFPGSILVFVSGNLQLAGEEHQLRFSQVGHLGSTSFPSSQTVSELEV